MSSACSLVTSLPSKVCMYCVCVCVFVCVFMYMSVCAHTCTYISLSLTHTHACIHTGTTSKMMNSFVQIFGIYAHFYKYMHMLTGDFESLVDGARRDFEAKEATMLENERVLREQVECVCVCVCVCVHVCIYICVCWVRAG